jgi:hypothetical protein
MSLEDLADALTADAVLRANLFHCLPSLVQRNHL